MLDHIIITVEDYGRSREFYERALAPLGYQVNVEFEQGCGSTGRQGHTPNPRRVHESQQGSR
jgi:hypothetical protein